MTRRRELQLQRRAVVVRACEVVGVTLSKEVVVVTSEWIVVDAGPNVVEMLTKSKMKSPLSTKLSIVIVCSCCPELVRCPESKNNCLYVGSSS